MPPDIDVPMSSSQRIENLEPDNLVEPPELNQKNFLKLCAMVTKLVDERKSQLNKISEELNELRDDVLELESADQVSSNVDELQKHVNKLARIVSAYRVEASEIKL